MPALKRIIVRVAFPGELKRSYPRINAGASTQKAPYRPFSAASLAAEGTVFALCSTLSRSLLERDPSPKLQLTIVSRGAANRTHRRGCADVSSRITEVRAV